MAVKDLEEYYSKMTAQYKELVKERKLFEQQAMDNMLPPEALDNFKDLIAPIKQNWERITYIMYLLHKPTKKSKHKQYDRQSKKLLSKIDKNNTADSVYNENKETLEKIRDGR